RVLITAGSINNVYGGNDISGNVYGGNALEILSSIKGDVYGGGNGSYPYTDSQDYVDAHPEYADYLFDGGSNPIDSLNKYRPNAENVWLHVAGVSEAERTYIGGSLYCGGNSAGLGSETLSTAKAELKVGAYATIDKVFLGSNGINMIAPEVITQYITPGFSSINLTGGFADYMKGVEVSIEPVLSFDDMTGKEYTTYIGALYLGGNVGSMSAPGTFDMSFDEPIVIYSRIVGGCNDANVDTIFASNGTDVLLTPNYKGGLITRPGSEDDPKVIININSGRNGNTVRLLPKKLTYDGSTYQLEWNITGTGADAKLVGGNIYGGCYNSGYVNGSIEINILGKSTDTLQVFRTPTLENSGIEKESQLAKVFTKALSAFGGGYGEDSEIWGSTTVNVDAEGYITQVYGGGEKGVIGKTAAGTDANGNPNIAADGIYGTVINLKGGHVDKIYGGGYAGLVSGNTLVNLDGGHADKVFGGACNADINGYSEVFIGLEGFPEITNIYGGNDFGGHIYSKGTHAGYGSAQKESNAYVEFFRGNIGNIFGGSYGDYVYSIDSSPYYGYDQPCFEASFVHIKNSGTAANFIGAIYGGSYGHPEELYQLMQLNSYVLINAPALNLPGTDIFGGGLATGFRTIDSIEGTSTVDLYQGTFRNVHGGSLNCGIVPITTINVPEESTVHVNTLFGGGLGSTNNRRCDVHKAYIEYHGSNARVDNAIYGGNCSYRRTIESYVNISAAVYNTSNQLVDIYGGGYGEGTWAECTHVYLEDGAEVNNVYGGGNKGKVYNSAAVTAQGFPQSTPKASYLEGEYNTNINISVGALVDSCVYGGGYGIQATVTGTTGVNLLGGTVTIDIYGGGENGHVINEPALGTTSDVYTNVNIMGGTVRNVYGGGYNGNVGSVVQPDGKTHVTVGITDSTVFANGVPAIQRSLYGGGYRGKVHGTTKTNMYNGYIGYFYNASGYDDPETADFNEKYEENLNYPNSTLNLLAENGNLFGGGYGEGAITDTTIVNFYGGHIRNSLYGGGEISSVGYGTDEDGIIPNTHSDFRAGATNVHMYGGHVHRNVFGGGRGYAIDSYGNTETGVKGYSDGYVFGTTSVYIHRGNIGTHATVLEGDGNVFGGGNIGYVYSGKGIKNGEDGYYYNTDTLTEDCKVIISPKCLVTEAFHTYQVGDYVDDDFMNTLPNNSPIWGKMDDLGINIGNAVFAGGNVSSGSDKVYANTETVFGNATASVVDIFDKDFITIGEDGIGGLYGDGNLTLVDGYRELNITNYGTDYYGLDASLTFEQYQDLNKRERAYYELKYQSKNKHTYSFYESKLLHTYEYTIGEGDEAVTVRVTYKKGQKITEAEWSSLSAEEQNNWRQSARTYEEYEQITENEYDLMDSAEKENWELYGFCTLYLGRMMNTIQRADFCGVFGSRIVMRGAQDRVTSVVDYTNYTINRVDEVSLNREHQLVGGNTMVHGNYFGIYSVVNYLGALTSDVEFDDIRYTDVPEYQIPFTMDGHEIPYGSDSATYYNWKYANLNNRKRNNGTSENEVALASGVWLEILDKETETAGEKVYGPITGVVQLNLINVSPGEGGGYVYAKNEHRIPEKNAYVKVALAAANKDKGAVSYRQFDYYDEDDPEHPAIKMQTSGNFVNSQKRIIDDCYPNQGAYRGSGAAPAHYWYIRGEYYVYNQTVSAYTGISRAYTEQTSIPLTITPESRGRLILNSVEKNLNAFWDDNQLLPKYQSTTVPGAIVVGGKTYLKNDPISAWDYSLLSEAEQAFFVEDETYICSYNVEIDGIAYTEDSVFITLPDGIVDYYVCTHTIMREDTVMYNQGDVITKAVYENLSKTDRDKCARVFNPTNAITHDNGFLLTFGWDNPDVWNNYFQYMDNTPPPGRSQIMRQSLMTPELEQYYVPGPTFKCVESGIYGQVEYSVGDIIDSLTYSSQALISSKLEEYGILDAQAVFKKAYVAKDQCRFTENVGGTPVTYNFTKGSCITEDEYNGFSPENRNYFEEGLLCVETYSVDQDEFYLSGEVIPLSTFNALSGVDSTVVDYFSRAFLCESTGHWGGSEFTEGSNYSAIRYSSLSSEERAHFSYNYDALDLLSEDFLPTVNSYPGMLAYQGEGHGITQQIPYAERQSLDYSATYTGITALDLLESVNVTRNGLPILTDQLQTDDILINTEYEKLTNEQFHFAPIVVSGNDPDDKIYYIVNNDFQVGNDWYTVGQKIEESRYNILSQENKNNVSLVHKNTLPGLPLGSDIRRYYFCARPYTAKTGITDIDSITYNPDDNITVGTIIVDTEYAHLINEQKNFSINGVIPTETTTFYVAREIDINQLSEDKIITVTYLYEYIESDESGTSYETVLERHIVNILIHFESGVPTIGELLPPATVLPGDVVGLNKPTVSKGAFEILGGGWEIFSNEQDAISHKNGSDFISNRTPVYWYEDGYWLAYYAKSYLGKTYSNPVKFSIANYHRMANVMASTHNETDTLGTTHTVHDYMYLNEALPAGKRAPKVYIRTAAELDSLAAFYNLTKGGNEGFENIGNCENIDFILDGNINHTTTWNSIGENGNCFSGTLHGDGYTISGLDHSLFNYLCGPVYNLGVSGSFTGSGIADHGGTAWNCWVMTTGNVDSINTKAVMGTGIIHNSYYPETNTFAAGSAISKPLKSFLNGEVAYNLNSYYLNKRYYDLNVPGGAKVSYDYWKREDVGVEGKTTSSSYYPDSYEMYVEERFGNIDFTFADGTIPTEADIRSYNGDDFAPIYPDDYIYFGQKLTYGIVPGAGTHNEAPKAIIRNSTDGMIVSGLTGNRVNRAPGYYGNSSMSQVYFNRHAGFKSSYNGADVYKDLTAIDFTGYNDNSSTNGTDQNRFFAPILDYSSLSGFITDGLTRNLLVYAKESESATFTVLTTNLPEATFTYNSTYSTVAVPANAAVVKGHLVTLKDGAYIADRNHYLVDKQNFNAPISYKFGANYYMWYQRTPDGTADRYIKNLNEGWETISLPFTADLVTTQTKGEITHFYGGSNIGHEYWLREFNSVNVSHDEHENDIFTGIFSSPAPDATADVKIVDNSYLWDYYYSKFSRKDKNSDLYKHYEGAENVGKDYYRTAREYSNYPLFAAGRPYLIGFPGETYYEFDLSGTFKAQNTYGDIPKIAKQTITFVSVNEASIGVSDSDYNLNSVENDGYRFNSSYQTVNLAANEGYMLNSGAVEHPSSKFVKNTAAATTVPFRPYFRAVEPALPAPSSASTRADVLFIGYAGDDGPIADTISTQGLTIYVVDHTIWIESTLEEPVKVDIFMLTGKPAGSIIVQPGSKESITVGNSGVYIVNRRKVVVL
ncbi:MAG: hypothetical protein ACOX59_05195, partial [Bacteroidales bacterium]